MARYAREKECMCVCDVCERTGKVTSEASYIYIYIYSAGYVPAIYGIYPSRSL